DFDYMRGILPSRDRVSLADHTVARRRTVASSDAGCRRADFRNHAAGAQPMGGSAGAGRFRVSRVVRRDPPRHRADTTHADRLDHAPRRGRDDSPVRGFALRHTALRGRPSLEHGKPPGDDVWPAHSDRLDLQLHYWRWEPHGAALDGVGART